jgi:hypothetical protein
VASLVARNAKIYGGVCGWVWWSLHLSAVMRYLFVSPFGTSVTMNMFSHLMQFIKRFKCSTFNVICKDNTAKNCFTVEHKEDLFMSILNNHTTLVVSNISNKTRGGEPAALRPHAAF